MLEPLDYATPVRPPPQAARWVGVTGVAAAGCGLVAFAMAALANHRGPIQGELGLASLLTVASVVLAVTAFIIHRRRRDRRVLPAIPLFVAIELALVFAGLAVWNLLECRW